MESFIQSQRMYISISSKGVHSVSMSSDVGWGNCLQNHGGFATTDFCPEFVQKMIENGLLFVKDPNKVGNQATF